MDIISFSEAATANSRIEIINANPDSTSGIITTPKTIASGETVTIPAGRVAILPNVQIDGVINIEGEVFVPSGATLGDLDAQIALKADTSYVNTQLGLKANTSDLKEIGVNQTWQDVTASRVTGVTYTNTTGKPILISISNYWQSNNGVYDYITVDGVVVVKTGTDNSSTTINITQLAAIVPNGSTYSVTALKPFKHWGELR